MQNKNGVTRLIDQHVLSHIRLNLQTHTCEWHKKMPHHTLLVLLLFSANLLAGAVTILYVKPTVDTTCPGAPCHTLDEYAQNASQYFISDTIVEFLPGTHSLSQPLNISGVNNLSWVARNAARNETIIWLFEALQFTNVSNLTLLASTLVFGYNNRTFLGFESVLHLKVSRVIFQSVSSTDTHPGIVVRNVFGSSTFEQNDFLSLHKHPTYILQVQYDTHEPHTHTQISSLTIRDSSIHKRVQFLFSQSANYIDIILENLTISHTIDKALDIEGSMCTPALYAVVFRKVSFVDNSDCDLVRVDACNVMFIDCDFSENSGHDVVYLNRSHNVTFINCNFSRNNYKSGMESGLVNLQYSYNVTFINCSIYENKVKSATDLGIMFLVYSYNVTFDNCSFCSNKNTAIWVYNSNFTLSGTVLFSDNTAYEGGALAFYGESAVYIANNTDVTFLNNTAENVGGAIFVRNPLPYIRHSCFLQFLAINTSSQCSGCNCSLPQSNINFINNTAKEGGTAIYGASVFDCWLEDLHCVRLHLLIHNSSYLHFEPSLQSDTSVISSDPTRVCLCESGKPNCTLVFNSGPNYTHYPGEEFFISAAVVGDMFGTVAGSAYAHILPPSNATLGNDPQQLQLTNSHKCTQLKYSLLSEPGLVVMAITANDIPVQSYPSDTTFQHSIDNFRHSGDIDNELLTTPVYINITILPCPLGFILSDSSHPQCVCDHPLHGHDIITCNISNQTIHRRGAVWVSSEDNETKLMITNHCPYGYCKTGDVNVSLDHPDTQCAFNRSGTLCGGCQPGLSLALGSPQCLDCSNNYHLALLIPFALAGIALVFFIKVLNLTVAKGTINGVIFYANIVQANQAVFFPPGPKQELYPIKAFIAWLNLDLGITTCFFDGLDGYWKTWLQFVFPVYLWAITALIIYLSHKFQSVAKILGNNSVPVLATLIFLSYTKLLRTVITALSFSFLEASDNSTIVVWSFDGNIEYLSGKHIPLFIVALAVLFFLWLPYTVLLLFEQCIQKIGNYWVRKWMLRIMPFLDAYFGPFRGEHRYWVGVLLVARVVLLLVFGLNSTNDPSVNLLAVITVAVLLLIHLPYDTHNTVYPNGAGKNTRFWGGSYYKKWYLSLLENSFILNLAMLATGSLYVLAAEGNQTVIIFTSVSITFCQFIVIIIFHGYNQFTKMLQSKWKQKIGELQSINQADYEPIPDQPVGLKKDEWPPYHPMNQCREPLLEDEDN